MSNTFHSLKLIIQTQNSNNTYFRVKCLQFFILQHVKMLYFFNKTSILEWTC